MVQRSVPPSKKPLIAYLSAEFGIDSNIPTYAGGLGILAADTLYQAAESEMPMVGVGMLYKGRRFIQKIDEEGNQIEVPTTFRAEGSSTLRRVEVAGGPLEIAVTTPTGDVYLHAYKQRISDLVNLYFLTADISKNDEYWRELCDEIYWGNEEEQIQQMVLLGIGAIKLLSVLKIKPSIYHIQEGRPTFALWELAKLYPSSNPSAPLSGADAKVLYTNHTLVSAGNIKYPKGLVEKYAKHYADTLSVSTDTLLTPGIEGDSFDPTKYAINHAREVSAVSKIHGKLSQKAWPERKWHSITNGVFLPRWQKRELLTGVSDDAFWQTHLKLKTDLAREVASRIGFGYNPNDLVVSWARRISSYKQVEVLFKDVKRLKSILSSNGRPVQLLIAGKAHPGDNHGKQLVGEIIAHMKGELSGYALFVHNYDIALAEAMTSGSDIWLNTPQIGMEACGTSGMKAISNGVLPMTILDGWAQEVNWEGIGWSLDPTDTAESIYKALIEAQNIYYMRNENGTPLQFVGRMKKAISIAQKYSTDRMLREYEKKLYQEVSIDS